MRNHLGLSQQKFADQLGIKKGRLSAYEDNSNPSDDFKIRITSNYHLKFEKFITEKMSKTNFWVFFTSKAEIEQNEDSLSPKEESVILANRLFQILSELKELNTDQKLELLIDEALKLQDPLNTQIEKLKTNIQSLSGELVESIKKRQDLLDKF